MKNPSPNIPGSRIRFTSSIWAICLLLPLPVVSSYCNNSFTFHLLLFLTGWLTWTYTEYFFHRFVMHEGNTKKGIGRLLNHNHHHTDPHDIRVNNFHRSMMIACCLLTAMLSVLFRNYTTLFFGYAIGFTVYSHMHVILHHKWSEKIFPGLHRFHIAHHCKHPDKCFGVVITWWDHLFGTALTSEIQVKDRIKNFYYKNNPVDEKNAIYKVCKN